MSRGPRIPTVGIPLGSLLSLAGGASTPTASTGPAVSQAGGPAVSQAGGPSLAPAAPVSQIKSAPSVNIVNLAQAWDQKAYGLGGASHSHGPTTTQLTFATKEMAKIRLHQETGPGLNEPLPRGVMLLPAVKNTDPPCGVLIDYTDR